MRAEDFTSDRAGRIVRTLQGYDAFVPHTLPPGIAVDWSLGTAIANAERALGNLSGIGTTLLNPHLLTRPFIRKEAVLSSRIEGTLASLSDLFMFEAAGMPERERSDVREVANYVRALEVGLERVKEIPISLRLLLELHDILMEGTRGTETNPGKFRQSQNWIGLPGARLQEAIFVPPPTQQMMDALGAFEIFLHEPQPFPFLVWLAVVHYQFEAIHPFRDGNGRIGRLLLTLLLCVHGVLQTPLLYLSAFFERNREEYYGRLLAVSQRGEWEQWVRFFLQAVEEQSRDAVDRAARLNELRNTYRLQLQGARASALLIATIDDLFKYPAVTIPLLKDTLGVTYRSAQQITMKLENYGILVEATGQARNRIFLAPAIIEIIED